MCALDQPLVDLEARKALGKAHLNANQIEDAIRVYTKILRDYPQDIDAYLFLGDCYLADGDANTALLLYSQALEQSPENEEVHRRLRLARNECVDHWTSGSTATGGDILHGEAVPTNPEAIAAILQELTNQHALVTEEEVMRAAHLLEQIVHSAHPAQMVAEKLAEINDLIPALLELNIRQARADGRQDLVAGLQNLLHNIQLQKDENQHNPARNNGLGKPHKSLKDVHILMLGSACIRQQADYLGKVRDLDASGARVTAWQGEDLQEVGDYDLLMAFAPHVEPIAMETLAGAHAAGVPILLYLKSDLEQMPVSHPEYSIIGLHTPALARAYASALILADVICVPGEGLASSLRSAGYQVEIIPDGWDDRYPLWEKPVKPRHTLNLGWIGSAGELEDVFTIRRMIVRVMREFPHLRLMIAGDPAVYQLFDSLPETRRQYLPVMSEEDISYVLGQMDILLVPLRNNLYNRSLSDIRLVQAGARGIPWIASPLPSLAVWGKGGLIANSPDEWHTYLRQLALDDDLRKVLGQTGNSMAQARRNSLLKERWFNLILETAG